jgi:hypothetical protein
MSIANQIRASIELLESIQLQEQFEQEMFEALVLESSLSKMVGNLPGGQALVRHLHRQHLLGNDADYEKQPINQRVMWKQFKNDPDNFLIVVCENGVAGVKPDPDHIARARAAAEAKGKEYNPATDTTLLYRVISYTDNGFVQIQGQKDDQQIHPELMKARGGLPYGGDFRNPNNIFKQLVDELGQLKMFFITRKAIERDKLSQRDAYKQPSDKRGEHELINAIFAKIKPVLPKLIQQAGLPGQPDATILRAKFKSALYKASGVANPEHLNSKSELIDFLRSVVEGNVQHLQQVLNALRTELRGS